MGQRQTGGTGVGTGAALNAVHAVQNVLHGMDCIECGACAYTCPARLPLTHMFRMGKQKVNNARMAAKAKAEAEKKAAEEKKEA